MALKDYHAKRNFKNTPEPKGKKVPVVKKRLTFVVQEHHASHLHFDFRLEADGVLKSWAVPKVPVMDPTIKRLAVQVEDHPLEYGKFAGIIPEGNYGAGEVSIWDKGTYTVPGITDVKEIEAYLKRKIPKGEIKFILKGKRLSGGFALVQLKDKKNWLLIKHDDDKTNAADFETKKNKPFKTKPGVPEHVAVPRSIKPMLATLVDKPFNGKDWLFEIKWDGYRAIAQIEKGNVRLYSRNNQPFNSKYPAIVTDLEQFTESAILDGEIVVVDKDGVAKFNMMQNYPEEGGELRYYVFDLLFYKGEDLRHLPLVERKKLLRQVLPKRLPHILYSDHIEEKGMAFYQVAVKEGLEGIIAKRADSLYLNGTRSSEWLKIKIIQEEEVIIAGVTNGSGSRKEFGSLILGVYEGKEFTYIGQVGSGFTESTISELSKLFAKQKRKNSPFVNTPKIPNLAYWLNPTIVAQVKFAEWTPDKLLRQAVFLGLREDKKAEQVVMERKSPAKALVNPTTANKNQVVFTNTDKVFWPEEGYTKGDVIAYYEAVAPVMLPYLKNRPENMNRHPNGINGESFFQKDVEFDTPPWVERLTIYSESASRDINYLVCQNLQTLLYMANLGCIEINPWNSRIQDLDYPDYLIFDLDPEGIDFKHVVEVALTLKKFLDELKITSYCKTTGGRGLHVYVPLGAKYNFEQVRQVSELIALVMQQRLPEVVSLERSPADRQGKVYIDYIQNRRGQTTVAPYSLRPRPHALVSAPLNWDEVTKKLDPAKFSITSMPKRIKKEGDLWKGVLGKGIDLAKSLSYLEGLVKEN